MKIALYDMDKTGFPNLALCKLKAWYGGREGHEVKINPDPLFFKPDHEMASRVFSWSPPIPKGVYTDRKLLDPIENTCPDTSDYDVDPGWAYGFTSRGCPRKCDFCEVWKKEGNIHSTAHPAQFVRKHHTRLIMLDNNWLAAKTFEHSASWLADRKIEVDPTQGLDIRLVTNEKAKILSRVRFTMVKFSFDSMDIKEQLVEGVQTLRHWKVRPARYQCFLLHRPGDDILERIRILEGLYVDPFVMPYIEPDGSRECSDIARWANKKQIYRNTPWENYDARK
jgi:hypothetical protein